MHVRLVCDVMTNGTEGFQPSSVTLKWTSTYGSFIFHHGELQFSHNVFVSSNWTERISSLVNFITYLEPPYLLDYNYIVVPLPTRFLWVHILMVKVCKNSSHLGREPKAKVVTILSFWIFVCQSLVLHLEQGISKKYFFKLPQLVIHASSLKTFTKHLVKCFQYAFQFLNLYLELVGTIFHVYVDLYQLFPLL